MNLNLRMEIMKCTLQKWLWNAHYRSDYEMHTTEVIMKCTLQKWLWNAHYRSDYEMHTTEVIMKCTLRKWLLWTVFYSWHLIFFIRHWFAALYSCEIPNSILVICKLHVTDTFEAFYIWNTVILAIIAKNKTFMNKRRYTIICLELLKLHVATLLSVNLSNITD